MASSPQRCRVKAVTPTVAALLWEIHCFARWGCSRKGSSARTPSSADCCAGYILGRGEGGGGDAVVQHRRTCSRGVLSECYVVADEIGPFAQFVDWSNYSNSPRLYYWRLEYDTYFVLLAQVVGDQILQPQKAYKAKFVLVCFSSLVQHPPSRRAKPL